MTGGTKRSEHTTLVALQHSKLCNAVRMGRDGVCNIMSRGLQFYVPESSTTECGRKGRTTGYRPKHDTFLPENKKTPPVLARVAIREWQRSGGSNKQAKKLGSTGKPRPATEAENRKPGATEELGEQQLKLDLSDRSARKTRRDAARFLRKGPRPGQTRPHRQENSNGSREKRSCTYAPNLAKLLGQ